MPSSVIRRFSYDPAAHRLRIVFVSGDVYDYEAVPPQVVEAFRAAGSKGRFFGPNIRDRYRHRRVARGADQPASGSAHTARKPAAANRTI
ncbi:MAG: KTSC domain-containing protein [Brevundimonas sp.]|uniref:KTSC domain-containing protein n=1 Tax=Brevundimonas sp. TaxID=1871086 RepID=UPI0025C18284|nr:KTSC domain-containing protein [Brevundimonas sp.]MBX3477518.1 KTSC domain-containing protein [Brevundimonas sp.]